MMSTNVQEQFFKALVDVDRLRVAGLLYERTLSVEAVANELGLQQKHTRHHLECLAEAGLVQVVSDSDGNGYRLNRQQFENLARSQFKPSPGAEVIVQADLPPDELKLLQNYVTRDGRLKLIPNQNKKMLVVLKYAAGRFDKGRTYTEKEVNENLLQIFADSSTLRRYLVDYQLLDRERDGSRYWRR
jgi:hypothetical protein